jgi:hypothetical protein
MPIGEVTDVAGEHPDICRRMSAKLKEYIESGKGMTFGYSNQKRRLNMGEVHVKEFHKETPGIRQKLEGGNPSFCKGASENG